MRRRHWAFVGKALAKAYTKNHMGRLNAEGQHLALRLQEPWVPIRDFEELCKEVRRLRARMSAKVRCRGAAGSYTSHYWAWLYTPEERRKQNLACGYNCTMDMVEYKRLDKNNGGRVRL